MSYDLNSGNLPGLRHALSQERERTRSMQAERDANWDALDRLRMRLRVLVPDVPEGGDLVAAVEAHLRESTAAWRHSAALASPPPDETTLREGVEAMAKEWGRVDALTGHDAHRILAALRALLSDSPADTGRTP